MARVCVCRFGREGRFSEGADRGRRRPSATRRVPGSTRPIQDPLEHSLRHGYRASQGLEQATAAPPTHTVRVLTSAQHRTSHRSTLPRAAVDFSLHPAQHAASSSQTLDTRQTRPHPNLRTERDQARTPYTRAHAFLDPQSPGSENNGARPSRAYLWSPRSPPRASLTQSTGFAQAGVHIPPRAGAFSHAAKTTRRLPSPPPPGLPPSSPGRPSLSLKPEQPLFDRG